MHQSTTFHDCRFTSWYNESAPTTASGTLTSVADIRCTETHPVAVEIYVVNGEADPTAAPGPASDVTGPETGDSAGLLVWSGSTWAQSPARLAHTLPAPPIGRVYTVQTIARFSDGCTAFQCDPPPPAAPAAPAAPGSAAPGSKGGSTGSLFGAAGFSGCQAEHDGTFDVDCEWQFTIVGRAPRAR